MSISLLFFSCSCSCFHFRAVVVLRCRWGRRISPTPHTDRHTSAGVLSLSGLVPGHLCVLAESLIGVSDVPCFRDHLSFVLVPAT